jgi:hypothetical protein
MLAQFARCFRKFNGLIADEPRRTRMAEECGQRAPNLSSRGRRSAPKVPRRLRGLGMTNGALFKLRTAPGYNKAKKSARIMTDPGALRLLPRWCRLGGYPVPLW